MLKGLNHLTLAVSDLERSFKFYTDILDLKPLAKWDKGAYLRTGNMWLCLALDKAAGKAASKDYTHFSFTILKKDFEGFSRSLLDKGVSIWQENKSEGKSLYILDPDGHKLEIHAGDLKSRLCYLKGHPYKGLKLY